jgi:hypothetical protein
VREGGRRGEREGWGGRGGKAFFATLSFPLIAPDSLRHSHHSHALRRPLPPFLPPFLPFRPAHWPPDFPPQGMAALLHSSSTPTLRFFAW